MTILQLIWHTFCRFPLSLWRLTAGHGISVGISMILLYYVAGYGMFMVFEPENSPLRQFEEYTWYFIVTISTVGYGDLTPQSMVGRVVAGGMIWTCIGAFGIVAGQLAAMGMEFSAKSRKGLMQLQLKNHIVIIGYHPDRSQQIYKQIISDPTFYNKEMVLCFSSKHSEEHPLPGEVHPVRGELDSDDVMLRACIPYAEKVLIDTGSDQEAMSVALAVKAHNPKAQIVVGMRDMLEGPVKMARICPTIECAQWHDFGLLVQALQDPGTAKLLQTLTMNDTGSEFYRLHIPECAGKWQFGDLLLHFKKQHNATLIGLTEDHSPSAAILDSPVWEHIVQGGNSLMYIAKERLVDVKFPSSTV